MEPQVSGREPGVEEEALLLADLRAGKETAFERLLREHGGRMLAVARRLVRNEEDARDAVQEAFVSAFRSLDRFEGTSRIATWLHRIVVNACLDRIRRRHAHPTVPLPDSGRPDDERSVRGVEPAAPAVDHDTALDVQQALSQLPEEQRSALILIDVQGYPVAEAAVMLGVAEGTIKSRCARGRARLATMLGHLRNPAASSRVGSSRADARAAKVEESK
jgi:RNA polymerase sigma-70 factor (ECF subfamily)